MTNLGEHKNEYYRIAAFLNMLGFQQSKNDLTEFWKPFNIDVKSQVVDQDEDAKYHHEGTIKIHLYNDYIRYSYTKLVALETGRLTVIFSDFTSKFTFDDLLKNVEDISGELFGSPEFEFYQDPYYNPATATLVVTHW